MKTCIFFFTMLLLALMPAISCKKDGPAGSQNEVVFYTPAQFCMGADLSYANQVLDFGGIYKDSGQVTDPYLVFRKHGANTIRLRLWNNPVWTKEIYGAEGVKMYNDLADVSSAISRAKELEMNVLLDFHYSDTWADAGKQGPPATWNEAGLNSLVDSIYQYTYHTLASLASQGLMPEMVQLGNEINCGLLWPEGNGCEKGWAATGELLNSAIRAVRNASISSAVKPKIVLHVAKPENLGWWLNSLTTSGGVTGFDIIGFSYYYMWSSEPVDKVSNWVALARTNYNKPVMLLETAYPWTAGYADSYNNILEISKLDSRYPATVDGQYNYMVKLTQEVIDGGGSGIFYWAPDWISSAARDPWGTGSAWECNTFFDFEGNSLPGIDFMTHAYHGLGI
jgi:arabinogalactan endo-1,4-beta-galactosidase